MAARSVIHPPRCQKKCFSRVGAAIAAARHGYALALHGSMGRDLDLIAVPWTDDTDPPEKLLKAIARFIGNKAQVRYNMPHPTKKPHGRVAYSFPIGHDGHYLDVSVTPRQIKSPKRAKRK